MAAMRMAVRPKLDLRKKYPSVQSEWEAFGVPRTVVADNAWEFVGSSFPDACADANISLEYAPIGEPNYKAVGERFFQTLNNGLIHKFSGSVPANPYRLKEIDIDPQSSAYLSIEKVAELVYHYVADVFAFEDHRGIDDKPIRVWRKGVAAGDLNFAQNLEELDRAFSQLEIRDRKLTQEGIRFKDLVYCSDTVTGLLADLYKPGRRIRFGTATIPKIRYYPEDLSRIFVWNELRGIYIALPCTNPAYAAGLSVRLHELVRASLKKEKLEFISEEELCTRRASLFGKIAFEVPEASIRVRQRAYRLLPKEPSEVGSHGNIDGVAIAGPKNRRGGDRPEKAFVRSRRKTADPSNGASRPLPLPTVADQESTPKPLLDPFANFDRVAAIEQARREVR